MSESVHIGQRAGIAIIAIDCPPVNSPNAEVRQALWDAVVAADQTPETIAIVLRGNGRTFGAGAELFDQGKSSAPSFGALCARIEQCQKPVIAALQGTVLANGAELALAAHYRIGSHNLRLGWTEIQLGLIPCGGTTQRLPRLVGAGTALDLLLNGRPVPAGRARSLGLVDRIVRGDIAEAGIKFAQDLVAEGAGPRRACDAMDGLTDPAQFAASVSARRADAIGDAVEAQAELISCVEGALLLPFEEGLAFEEAAFETLRGDNTAQALRHIFMAERSAARYPDLAAITPREVRKVGVIGGGRALDFVARCLDAGLQVFLSESDEATLEDSYAALGERYDRRVALGQITEEQAEEHLSALHLVCGFSPLQGCDLVIDTNDRDPRVAAETFNQLDSVLQAGAILASSVRERMTEVLRSVSAARQPDVVGMHIQGLGRGHGVLELLLTGRSSKTVIATCIAFAGRLALPSIRSSAQSGGAGKRLEAALDAAADALVLRGADPATVDRVLTDWGLSEGPFAARDRRGLENTPSTPLTEALVRAGAHRVLSPGAAGSETDPMATVQIARLRAETADRPRSVSAETITRSAVAALANAGAQLVSESAVRCPSDIDVLAVWALGLSRRVGGPMKAADLEGLLPVRKSLDRLGQLVPGAFEPAPVLDDLIKNGLRFDRLNRH